VRMEENRSIKIATVFSCLSTSFRLPSLLSLMSTDYTTRETSHEEVTCLQAGRCNVKEEESPFQ